MTTYTPLFSLRRLIYISASVITKYYVDQTLHTFQAYDSLEEVDSCSYVCVCEHSSANIIHACHLHSNDSYYVVAYCHAVPLIILAKEAEKRV